MLGIWSEEIYSQYNGETNQTQITIPDWQPATHQYTCVELCDLILAQISEVLGVCQHDFYQGRPAITCNHYGQGQAYYQAARTDSDFLADFYQMMVSKHEVCPSISLHLPQGAVATARQQAGNEYIFV